MVFHIALIVVLVTASLCRGLKSTFEAIVFSATLFILLMGLFQFL